jgi:hypothetical protein
MTAVIISGTKVASTIPGMTPPTPRLRTAGIPTVIEMTHAAHEAINTDWDNCIARNAVAGPLRAFAKIDIRATHGSKYDISIYFPPYKRLNTDTLRSMITAQ